jgi:uncharacterized membrane protein YczE
VPIDRSRWAPSPARFAQLLAGLATFGAGEAMLVASGLGNSPWSVLAQGLGDQIGISVGAATVLVSAFVLLAWIPLRQAPGLGSICNALLIGVALDATLALLPDHAPLGARAAMIPAGIALVALGSGLYLTTRLGPGPRDGLMTGFAARGHSIRVVRTAIELTVLATGWLLGGTVGVGTVLYAVSIGPLAHVFVPFFSSGRVPAPVLEGN